MYKWTHEWNMNNWDLSTCIMYTSNFPDTSSLLQPLLSKENII